MTIFNFDVFGLTLAPTYYGLMYALGFIFGYLIIKKRGVIYNKVKKNDLLEDLFFYVFLGVVLGGRLGYMFFYNFSELISNPFSLFKIWEGGMSFHGGVIGVIISMYIFGRKNNFSFLKIADQVTLVLPIGLGLGRIGNYLNEELLGYSGYNGLFAVYKDGIGYFPSPLLEFALEGLLLFAILNTLYFYSKIKKSFINFVDGQIACLFLIFYSIFRIFVEIFFRLPDAHIGYFFGFITTGQLLSIPMFVFGLYFFIRFGFKK